MKVVKETDSLTVFVIEIPRLPLRPQRPRNKIHLDILTITLYWSHVTTKVGTGADAHRTDARESDSIPWIASIRFPSKRSEKSESSCGPSCPSTSCHQCEETWLSGGEWTNEKINYGGSGISRLQGSQDLFSALRSGLANSPARRAVLDFIVSRCRRRRGNASAESLAYVFARWFHCPGRHSGVLRGGHDWDATLGNVLYVSISIPIKAMHCRRRAYQNGWL